MCSIFVFKLYIKTFIYSCTQEINSGSDNNAALQILAAVASSKQTKKKQQNKIPSGLLTEKQHACQHTLYDNGCSYKEEENARYCRITFYLHDKHCNECNIAFVESEDAATSTRFYKPTTKTPVMCCINYKTCTHAICRPCFNELSLKADTMNTSNVRQGRKRTCAQDK